MYNDYVSSTLELARSMVIKNHYYASAIEDSILTKKIKLGLPIETDLINWKYYLNISGEYHPTDQIMTVISLDTLEEIEFTKENLEVHRSTFKGYVTQEKYRKELLERYPENLLLIKSILNPVDIEKAIKSPNYTILQWDENLIEAQETDLIVSIQARIDIHVENWFNSEYTIFDMDYYQEFYKSLVLGLPLFIMEIREANEFTYKVHSYHLWSHLETKAGLYKFKNYLNFQQANWLYRNINHIIKNLGKQSTFDDLVQVLLTDKNIPIGRYIVDALTERMDSNESLRPLAIVKKEPMNLITFVGAEARDSSINNLMKKQLPLGRSNAEDYDAVLAKTQDELDGYIQTPVKVYETDVISSNEDSIYSLSEVLIYHWAYYSHENIYKSRFFIRNAKTGSMMTMDSKEAFNLYYYLLAKRVGNSPTKFPTIELHHVIDPKFDKDKEIHLFGHVVPSAYISLFNDNYPEVKDFISSESFREACVDYRNFLVRMNNAIEFCEDFKERQRYEEYMHRRHVNGVLDMAIDGFDSIEEWIVYKDWDIFEVDDAGIEAILLELETKILALDTSVIDPALIQKKMTQLLNELSSYNIQIVSSGNLEDVRLNQTTVPEIGNYVCKTTLDMNANLSFNDDRMGLKKSVKNEVTVDLPDEILSKKDSYHNEITIDMVPEPAVGISSISYVDIF